ncbi:MAG TPA: hypothetical protein VFP40_12840 [Terriglobales bacterium]|nr:hypothetical protein [Terriglobales bacterium]
MRTIFCGAVLVAITAACGTRNSGEAPTVAAQATGQVVVIGRDSVIVGHGDSVIFRRDSVIVGHGDTITLAGVLKRRCHFEFTWYQPMDAHTAKTVTLVCPKPY